MLWIGCKTSHDSHYSSYKHLCLLSFLELIGQKNATCHAIEKVQSLANTKCSFRSKTSFKRELDYITTHFYPFNLNIII